ncbi:MAG: succinate dehydrogenase assembly factor 2 [Gammaproteobacteria bacterium HGW-Gammaproteobacteria-3]|nr:MAG: succinate dehydrogenase assembly factor 2 [Gammaproteobacteria bacterium HGW-Gammaproteobacteria-3]
MSLKGRLKWQCRRGARELDEILEKYLDEYFEAASAEEQSAFIELLKCEDAQLLHYFLSERGAADAKNLSGIVQKIKLPRPVAR